MVVPYSLLIKHREAKARVRGKFHDRYLMAGGCLLPSAYHAILGRVLSNEFESFPHQRQSCRGVSVHHDFNGRVFVNCTITFSNVDDGITSS